MSITDLKVLLIGHISLDLRGGELMKGGPAQYQIPILIAKGIKHIDILTSCRDISITNHEAIRVYNVQSEETTTFSFTSIEEEGKDDRELILEKKARDFTNDNLDLLGSSYDLIIVSGIAGEISLGFIQALVHKFSDSIIAIDAQTLTRKVKIGGIVKIETIGLNLINQINPLGRNIILKGSFIELGDITNIDFDGIILRTNSGLGIEFVSNNKYQMIKFDKLENNIIDSTGSGDIFLIVFMLEFVNTKNLAISLNKAHQITKNHLYIKGIPSIIESRNIIESVIDY